MSISIIFWNKNYVTVSLYLANMDGSIGSTNKSQLNTIHGNGGGVSCPTIPPTTFPTCTIIDGMALIYNMEYNSVFPATMFDGVFYVSVQYDIHPGTDFGKV